MNGTPLPPIPAAVQASEDNPHTPVVSIIMSMRNSAATVGAAIRSIQLQTLTDWELIVIDDGSTDRSCAIVSAFGDPRILLVRESETAGLATRLNQAVALSRGNFIARMDADDLCFPNRLQLQIARLQEDPTLDVLGCAAIVFADDATLIGTLPLALTHEQITARPFSGFPLPHPTWCGRADWFRKNPYDARLSKAQDQDLLLRTFKFSRFAALPDVLVGYRQDILSLRKMLQGRRTFVGSLYRHGRSAGDFLPASKGILLQILKSAADIVSISLGLNRPAQRYRLKPVPLSAARRWLKLQRRVFEDSEEAR